MTPLQIRPATPADLETIVQFNASLAWESEGKKLDLGQLRCGVAAVLDDPIKGRYFLAQTAEAVIGQVMITWEWSDWRNGWFWWLQSVYVRPEYRRRGVLRGLVGYLEELARQQGNVIGLRLYVDRTNEVALVAYESLGLENTRYGVMELYPWPRRE